MCQQKHNRLDELKAIKTLFIIALDEEKKKV